MKLLIAHGDATSRFALREVAQDLSALGLESVESSGSEQAVELLTGDDAPGLAVVDWDLPGVGGPELCRQVRARCHSGPPYIILLARTDEQIGEAFAAGANDCLNAAAGGHELQARLFARGVSAPSRVGRRGYLFIVCGSSASTASGIGHGCEQLADHVGSAGRILALLRRRRSPASRRRDVVRRST